jgi:hypothetical protein
MTLATANDGIGQPRRFIQANGRFRRLSPVASRPRESPLTEPTPAARARPLERVFMPRTRPSRRASGILWGGWHEDALPRPRLSARYRFSQGTFAGSRGNGRNAPIPAVRLSWVDESSRPRSCENVPEPRKRRTVFSIAFSDSCRQHFWFSN